MLEQSIGCVLNITLQIVSFILAALCCLCGSIIQLWKRISYNPLRGHLSQINSLPHNIGRQRRIFHRSIHYPTSGSWKAVTDHSLEHWYQLSVFRKMTREQTNWWQPSIKRASEQWGDHRIISFLTVMVLFSFLVKYTLLRCLHWGS